MFPENKNIITNKGWIEVITGPMFSGKTEELLRRVRRAQIANQQVHLYKPEMENRYAHDEIVSHNKLSMISTPVKDSDEILIDYKGFDVTGIDEAQFFDSGLVDVVNEMANNGKRVIVVGLDMDFQGRPFNSIPQIMAIAEYVTKLHAICVRCGDLASFSHRKTASKNLVELGENNIYEPLCRNCMNKIKV